MKRKRFTEEQIIGVLQRWEAGQTVANLSREMGVSHATIYEWRKKYQGLMVSDARRLKSLEDENRQLKRIVGDAPRALLPHPPHFAFQCGTMAAEPVTCLGPAQLSSQHLCDYRILHRFLHGEHPLHMASLVQGTPYSCALLLRIICAMLLSGDTDIFLSRGPSILARELDLTMRALEGRAE